jgi:hydrogenase maturation protein HypF
VGFRPFIYNIAIQNNIYGNVINDTEGVLIHASGLMSDMENFLSDIKKKAPPLALIQSIKITSAENIDFTDFRINKSEHTDKKNAFYSIDSALCQDCLNELLDKKNRRNKYPFITCINCGPRFSIINDIPYDRENTSMKGFEMCNLCRDEFKNTQNRRFHAQPNACHECGPEYSLYDNKNILISDKIDEILNKSIKILEKGDIIAIKGLGGYHLAVDANNDYAVNKLRTRKNRPFKPFAIMIKDIKKIKKYFHTSPAERDLLKSPQCPILLLKINENIVSKFIAPGLSQQGVMLPYTPFHHLLFKNNENLILVMTSGNISDEPIVYKDDNLQNQLGNIADYFITYNREITSQNDDSVLYVIKNKPYFIRRSRGYIPTPIFSSHIKKNIFATGGDLKSSFAIAKNDTIILSQFLGDMSAPETYKAYKKTANHFIKVFDAKADIIVSDMHPNYITTTFADELADNKLQRIKIQHHHAHIASVIEDRKIEEDVIGIAFDGTGYGTDNNIWGSEFFTGNLEEFTREAHFSYFPLPGGDKAIRDVWKIGVSLLRQVYKDDIPIIQNKDMGMVLEIIKKNINSPLTCSIGRIFDGISAILGLSESISTEAEAAQLLEEAALKSNIDPKPYIVKFEKKDDIIIIDTKDLVKYIVNLLENKIDKNDIAKLFHLSIIETSVKIAERLRKNTNINSVVLSGGVFHNKIILSQIIDSLEKKGFTVYTPNNIPFNDSGIAVGQIAMAKKIIKRNS